MVNMNSNVSAIQFKEQHLMILSINQLIIYRVGSKMLTTVVIGCIDTKKQHWFLIWTMVIVQI